MYKIKRKIFYYSNMRFRVLFKSGCAPMRKKCSGYLVKKKKNLYLAAEKIYENKHPLLAKG